MRCARPARVTRDVECLTSRELLDVLLRAQDWDADDLWTIAQRHGAVFGKDPSDAASGFGAELLASIHDGLSVERLAYEHFVLGQMGYAIDEDEFFVRGGQPRILDPGIEFVQVPSGSFLMGAPEDEAERFDSEGPQRQVEMAEFHLAATAVTNAQYAHFDPTHEPRRWSGVSDGELGDHPVVNVSWWEAYLSCAWIGGRMPSEAEWEYACRTGTATPFETGANLTTEQANYDGNHPYAVNPEGGYRQRTVAARSFEASAWGLFQMHGNVYEWCLDHWHDNYADAPSPDHS